MNQISYKQLGDFICGKLFIGLDLFGVFLLPFAFVFPDGIVRTILLTLGSTFLTLGISLPFALYFQNKHSSDNFKIIKSCDQAGIISIFTSRKRDGDDIRKAIDEAAHGTGFVDLLGVAFPSFLNPTDARTPRVESMLQDSSVKIRILILDPKSQAADRRADIEAGSNTIEDINRTRDQNIASLIHTRLIKLRLNNSQLDELENSSTPQTKLNVEVRLYQFDPVVFLMVFSDSMFVEQYHFGRAPGKVFPLGCIGKYVPVMQFKKDSDSYAFLRSHFNYVWKHGKDETLEITKKAITRYKAFTVLEDEQRQLDLDAPQRIKPIRERRL